MCLYNSDSRAERPQPTPPREAVFRSLSSPPLFFPSGPGEGPCRAREPRLRATPTGSATQQGTLLGRARTGAGGRGAGAGQRRRQPIPAQKRRGYT